MSKEIIELNEQSFESTVSHGNWAVDFGALWCGPCKMMAPHFEAAAKEMKGKVSFAKVDIDDNYKLAQRFEIMSVPAIILLKNGEEINRNIGALQKDAILGLIEETFD